MTPLVKPLIVRLTPAEAKALLNVIGEVIDADDVFEVVCDTKRERNAATRAFEKLRAATYREGT